jgi:hypothetical protein
MRVDGPSTPRGIASAAVAAVLLGASVALAPSAVGDTADSLRAAVTQLRGSSCGGLRSNPIVEQAALNVNQSTDKWVDFTARAVPVPDAVPLLKDLGYGGSKAAMVFGAGQTEARAMKGLLLEGYKDIPDCSYTDFGASVLTNQTNGNFLMAVVLAGP